MGKRTREKTEEEIKTKIKCLEKELRLRNLTPREQEHEEDFTFLSYDFRNEIELDSHSCHYEDSEEEPVPDISTPTQDACLPPYDKNVMHEPNPNSVKSVVVPNAEVIQTEEEIIPDEVLEALGEAKKSEETFGKKIPQGVSERLGKILTEGLAKDQRENFLTKVLLVPENFQLVKAPVLNTEVASALTDPAKNRDKRIERLQYQLGCGIAGLVNLTCELINNEINKMDIIKKILEVNQILLDLHYQETMNRRKLVIPMLDKDFFNIVKNVKRDKFLFGDKLDDNIKTSKSLQRSSLQIKKSTPQQSSAIKKPGNQAGNSRAPVRYVSGPNATGAQPSTTRFYPQPPPPAVSRRPLLDTTDRRRAPPPPPPPAQRHQSQNYRNRRR